MIKSQVTVFGTISKAATVRNNKEGRPFTTFTVDVVIQPKNGINKTIEVSVIKDGSDDLSAYVVGGRVEVVGELTFKKKGENIYFNLNATSVNHSTIGTEDSIKGELHFKGSCGKQIEEKTTKNGKPMFVFSAYSCEKNDDGFAFTWVRFVQFDASKPAWLQPKSTIEASGDLELSVFNDRLDIGCKLSELKQWDKPQFVPRDTQMKHLDETEELSY